MKENRRKLLWIVVVVLCAFELGFKPIGFAPVEKPSDLSEATITFERSLVGIPPKALPSAKAATGAESRVEGAVPAPMSTESLALPPAATTESATGDTAKGSQGQDEVTVAPGAGPVSISAAPEGTGAEATGSQAVAPPKGGMSVEELATEMWQCLDQQGVPVLEGGVSVVDREVKLKLAVPRGTPRAEALAYREKALTALDAQYSDRGGVPTLQATGSALQQKDRDLVVWQLGRLQIRRPVPQVKLGLDLQGGTRIVMEAVPLTHYVFVETPETGADATAEQGEKPAAGTESSVASESSEEERAAKALSQAAASEAWAQTAEELKQYLEGQNRRVFSIVPNPSGVALDVVTAKKTEADEVLVLVREFLRRDHPDAVLLGEPESIFIQNDTIQRVREIMQRRVDLFGLSEPLIQTQGDRRITIEIAGQTPENIREAMSEPADLKLMYIDPSRYTLQNVPIPLQERDPRNPAKTEKVEVYDAVTGKLVDHKTAINDPKSKTIIRGADMKDNSQAQPGQSGAWEVSFELKRQAADTFREFTSKHIKDFLPIVLNDVIESAPQIETTIGAQGRITGKYTIQQANNLKTLLNAGALPIKLEMKENRSVSATLGASNVAKSLLAGGIGIILVYIFMVLYYRLPGLVADVALTLYCGIVLAVLVMFNAVLTLTGIAGLILGVGMAVDANILIFERMKEELRTKSLTMSLKIGFERAWTAIFDANSTTLITATILWLLGSGSIRGFATTLIVSVLASLFTAVYVSRVLLEAVIGTPLGRHAALFLGARRDAFAREEAQRGRRPL